MPLEIVEQTPDAPTEPVEITEPAIAPEAAPATEGETPLPAVEEPKQTRFQRRIDQLTRTVHDLKRELDAKGRPADPPPVTDHEPQETDFADYGTYLKALTKYEIRQAQADSIRETNIKQHNKQTEKLASDFQPQIQAARTKYEDFDNVVAQPIFSPTTQEMLLHSPHGAEIAYYMGSTPQGQAEAMRINGLSPVAAAREIIKLEARLDAPPKKTVSAAPAPIEPVAGNLVSTKDPNKMTTVEWMAWDKSQRIEKLKTRPF